MKTTYLLSSMQDPERTVFLDWFKVAVPFNPNFVRDGITVVDDQFVGSRMVTGDMWLVRDGQKVWGTTIPFEFETFEPFPESLEFDMEEYI